MSAFHLCHSTSFSFLSKTGVKSPIFAIFTRNTGSVLELCFKSPLVFCFSFFKCLCYLRSQKLPSWGKNICSVFFPRQSFFFFLQSSNVCFSPTISVLPFIYQVIYSYIYLKHRSIANNPGALSSNSLFRDGAQAIPQLQVSGRVCMGGRGKTHTSQWNIIKRVIIIWW